MKKIISFICLLVFCSAIVYSQTNNNGQDSTINNLVHTPGYKTIEYGAIPQYVKAGSGNKTLILIPGLGFDASVFQDFMDANKNNYTMYAITIPGYGKTNAPPMPDTTLSYGEQPWNKSAVEGIVKLIKKQKLEKPIIVGHFVHGSQLALRIAIDYPDFVGGVIILGGTARFAPARDGKIVEPPLKDLISYTDKYTGPKWFKHMKKSFFDDNNFQAAIYSNDNKIGSKLKDKVSEVAFPVIVRYSCEYFASDVSAEFDKIKCPVLVLRATFSEKTFIDNPVNKNWVHPQFIDSWNKAPQVNFLIKIVDVPNAASFVWKDNPNKVYKEIKSFLK